MSTTEEKFIPPVNQAVKRELEDDVDDKRAVSKYICCLFTYGNTIVPAYHIMVIVICGISFFKMYDLA